MSNKFVCAVLLFINSVFLRKPPVNTASKLIERVVEANSTRRLLSYVEAGCVNTHDRIQNMKKCEFCITLAYLNFLQSLICSGGGIVNQRKMIDLIICVRIRSQASLCLHT